MVLEERQGWWLNAEAKNLKVEGDGSGELINTVRVCSPPAPSGSGPGRPSGQWAVINLIVVMTCMPCMTPTCQWA